MDDKAKEEYIKTLEEHIDFLEQGDIGNVPLKAFETPPLKELRKSLKNKLLSNNDLVDVVIQKERRIRYLFARLKHMREEYGKIYGRT